MELDLEEAVFGVEKQIEVPTLVECGTCKGAGSADGKTSTCDTCRGHGRVRMQNGIFSIQQACPHCGGTRQGHRQSVRGMPRRRPRRGRSHAVGQDSGRRRQRRSHSSQRAGRSRTFGRAVGRSLCRSPRARACDLPARRRRSALRSADPLRAGRARRDARGADARWRSEHLDSGRDADRQAVPACAARASSRCAPGARAICSATSSSRRR